MDDRAGRHVVEVVHPTGDLYGPVCEHGRANGLTLLQDSVGGGRGGARN